MPDGEVKIHIVADGDSKKIEDMQKRIAELRRAADAYDKNTKVDMSGAAKSARSEAAGIEREIGRMTKARAAEERAVTQQLKEQDALKKAGVGRKLVTMRSLTSAGIGAIAGDIFSSVIDQFAAGEMLSNRRTATEQRNQRQFGILNSIRGTSSEMVADSYAAEDRIAERKRDRPQIESENKFNMIKSAGEGAAWGAGIGAAVGSIVPVLGTAVGAGVGAVIGAGVKGIPAYLQGKNRLNQSDQDQAQDEEKLKKDNEEAPKKFMREEGGLQLDALRQRSKRTLEGSRAAFTDDMAGQWLKTYRDIFSKSKDKGFATEGADLTVQNQIRDRQATAGAGLVDARTGSAGIAAAAQWGMRSTGGWQDVVSALGDVRHDMNQGNQANQIVPLHK